MNLETNKRGQHMRAQSVSLHVKSKFTNFEASQMYVFHKKQLIMKKSNQPMKISTWYLHADLSELEKEPSHLFVKIIRVSFHYS